MDLQYIVKDFKPSKSVEHNVDSAPTNIIDKNEINDINDRLLYIENILRNAPQTPPPNDFNDVELTDDEITDVRTYLLYVSDKYFHDIPLNNNMRQQFIWNIPRAVYETHQYCQLYMYPDVLDPLFWMIISVLDMSHEVMCKSFVNIIDNLKESDYDFAKEIIENNINEENENE